MKKLWKRFGAAALSFILATGALSITAPQAQAAVGDKYLEAMYFNRAILKDNTQINIRLERDHDKGVASSGILSWTT